MRQQVHPLRPASLPLVGLYFAIPAVTVAWAAGRSMGNPFWVWIPLPVAVGTFLTAVVVWKLMVSKTDGLARKTMAGAIIGVLAHPVSALATSMVMPLLQSMELVPQQETGVGTFFESVVIWFNITAFLVCWWCLISLFGIGWLTLAIGALTGFVVGATSRTVNAEELDADHHPKVWRSICNALKPLAIITTLCGLACVVLIGRSPAPQHEIIEEKHAPEMVIDEEQE